MAIGKIPTDVFFAGATMKAAPTEVIKTWQRQKGAQHQDTFGRGCSWCADSDLPPDVLCAFTERGGTVLLFGASDAQYSACGETVEF